MLIVGVALGVPNYARAQGINNCGPYPCVYSVQDLQVQSVPLQFKFQARISQSKIPVGNTKFTKIYVSLEGGPDACKEEWDDVYVRDSVLNLEIGSKMFANNCPIETVIARSNDLKVKICLNNQSNCLQAVKIGSVPFAMKANTAAYAQSAYAANTSNEAHYAHRTSADRDLFLRGSLGTGYYDFETPDVSNQGIYSATDFVPYSLGGFIHWAPMSSAESANTVQVCGEENGRLRALNEFVVVSNMTTLRGANHAPGHLTVTGNASVNRDMHVDGFSSFIGGVAVGAESENYPVDLWVASSVQFGDPMSSPIISSTNASTFYTPSHFYGEIDGGAGHALTVMGQFECPNCIDRADINETQVQVRVSSVCVGAYMTGINSDGTVTCAAQSPAVVPGGTCTAGQVVIRVGADGTVVCGNLFSTYTPLSDLDCGFGQVVVGLQNNGVPICTDAPFEMKGVTCAVGEYLEGISVLGAKSCKPLPSTPAGKQACADGKWAKSVNADGTLNCEYVGSVPVGTVLDWYRVDTSTQPPVGFAIADGHMITDPESTTFNNRAVPDLRGLFVIGSSATYTEKSVGGAVDHQHSTNISHTHTEQAAGVHSHKWLTATVENAGEEHGRATFKDGRGVDVGLGGWNGDGFAWNDGREDHGTYYPRWSYNVVQDFMTNDASAHTHTINSAGSVAASSTRVGHLPPYIGLLKIIRIK